MSVLSEQDIIDELGKGILIYPFQKSHLTGSCLALTASSYAYSIKDKKLLDVHSDPNLPEEKFFILPPRDTVLVWTNESVCINDSFCGSIIARVRLVSKGIGHIGTRVNPNWGGILCITLHNLSDATIQINLGESIAYLRFHKLLSKSWTPKNLHNPARPDILPESCPVPDKLHRWIHDTSNRWRRGNEDALKEQLENDSPDYKVILRDRERQLKSLQEQSTSYKFRLWLKKLTAPVVLSALILIYLRISPQNPLVGNLILAIIPVVGTIAVEITLYKK
jgi:deoxycytidine triphosphate deaminase